jgi:DNA mismatch repair protein MutL
MGKIRILNDQLTNKIAAGEVVQRPASVVKELVENSIDAGATEITVVIRNGGKSLCEISDNGEGMDRDDLLLAFERYATSKIESVDDLIQVRTLGFRGEALASIAAVARVLAASTQSGSAEGAILRIEGGHFREIKPHSPKAGTRISIQNLFFNVPARRKFLKSREVEFRNIVEVLRKFALIRPGVRFTLIHDDREVFDLQPSDLKERIGQLFAPEYQNNLLLTEKQNNIYQISGFIGNLNLLRARRGEQYLFVNHRFVTDHYLNHAVIAGYGGLISRGEFPFYALHLQLEPKEVDVNVHPSKMEVKFQHQDQIYQLVKSAVEESLREISKVAPDLERFAPEVYYSAPSLPKLPRKTEFSSEKSGLAPVQQRLPIPIPRNEEDKKTWQRRAQRFREQPEEIPEESISIDVPVYQFHNKYIVSQVKSGLILIDQHVAHERVLYEEALASMEHKQWKAQQLLFPLVIELSVTDFSSLLEILPYLEKLGFRIKEFGKNTVAVDAVPAGIRLGSESNIIKDIIDSYVEYGTKNTSIHEKLAAAYSCRAAVKSGDALSPAEMRDLVDRLFATHNPYFCPHGRPIIVNLSLKELDKRFERT